MGTVESAIVDLVKETVEDEYTFPSEEDIENMVAAMVGDRIDSHLDEIRHEIEIRTLRYKVKAMRERVRAWMTFAFLGKKTNTRKVMLWTLIF